MRKLRNQNLYKVFNKATGEIKSSGSTKEDAKKQLRLLRSLEKKEKLTGGADEQPQIPQQPPQLQPLQEPEEVQDPLANVDFQAIGEAMLQQGLEQAQAQAQIPANRIREERARIREQMKGGGAGASTQNRLSQEDLIDIIERLRRHEIRRSERTQLINFIGNVPEERRTVFENSALSALLMYSIARMINTERPETPDTDPESDTEQDRTEGGGAGASVLQAQQRERDRRRRELQEEIERQENFVRRVRETEERINALNRQEASQQRERELMMLEDRLRELVMSPISSLGSFSSVEGDGYRYIGGVKRKAEQEAPRTPPRPRRISVNDIYRVGSFLHGLHPNPNNIDGNTVRQFINLIPADADYGQFYSQLNSYIEGQPQQIRDKMMKLLKRIQRIMDEGAETDPEGAGMLVGDGLYADDMKQLLDASYDKRNYDVGDYKIDHDLSDPRVKVYTNEKTGKVVSVHRGSADWRDWLDNYKLVTRGEMKSSGTYKDHKKKQDAINAKYGTENQILLGHSRAGKYVEELNKEKGKKYGEAITYNKATNWTDIGRKNPENQTDVRVSNDPVSALRFLQKGKNKETIKNKGWNPFKAHGTGKLSDLGKRLIGKGFNPKKMRVKDMRDFLRDHHKVNGVRKAYGKVPKKQLVEEIRALEGGYCGCEGGNVGEERRTENELLGELYNLRREIESNYRELGRLPRERRNEIVSDYLNRLRSLYDDAFRYRANPKVRDDYNNIGSLLEYYDMEAGREYIDSPHSSDDEDEDEGVMEAGAVEGRIKPFFCRIGSKRVILDEILKEIPQHTKYVEPFVGGGSVFWNRPPSIRSVINDLDKCLIEGYRLIKKASSDINKYPFPLTEKDYAEVRRIDYKDNPHDPRVKKYIKKIQDFVDSKGGSTEKQLLKILYKFCNTFGSKGTGKIFRLERGVNKIKKIDEYKDRLKDTTILSDDYKQVIKEHDGKDTFFFLDPPYEGAKELYKEGGLNLEELRKTVDGIKGKFLLTLNDSPTVRKAFKGYKIKKIKVAGGAGHGGQRDLGGIGQKERNELFISNY